MSEKPNYLLRIWLELKGRKVAAFFLGYVATCVAVIEFVDISSDRFDIPESTIKLLYLIAILGLPFAITIPWVIFRKRHITNTEKPNDGDERSISHNIPSQITTFIGRKKETEEIQDLIKEHRLVSLTGPGGCGKTRLACEVATLLFSDYSDGVWFVDLSPVSDENMVSKEILEALNIPEEPGKSILKILGENIRDKNLLIIIDNCEHLVKSCALITANLLQTSPGLKVLTTSREALGVKGEKVWIIPSLSLPNDKAKVTITGAKNSEAVKLFTDRAQLNNPDFSINEINVGDIVNICTKLDGIPLAIELAASRTIHMEPNIILEKITGGFDQFKISDPSVPDRQKTLQATIEWSYSLLSDNEKKLFIRLVVFAGGFDLSAAEEICSDDELPKNLIMDLLNRLVERSVIYSRKEVNKPKRYRQFETIKQFAKEKLHGLKSEEYLKEGHLLYYLKLAEQAFKEQFDLQLHWLNKLDLEHDNLMSALNWSEKQCPEKFVLLSSALGWFWILHSHYILGKKFLEKALSKSITNPESKARVLSNLGVLRRYLKAPDQALENITESLKIYEIFDSPIEKAIALGWASELYIAIFRDFETGFKYSKQSLELARKIGKPGLINQGLLFTCQSLVYSKQFKKAATFVEDLLVSSEELSQPLGIMGAYHFRSDCFLGMNNFIDAEISYSSGIEKGMEYGNLYITTADIQGVAFACSGQSRWAKAIKLNAAALKKFTEMCVSMQGMYGFWDEWMDTYIGGAAEKLGKELTSRYEEEGKSMKFDQVIEYALDFNKN